jgi:hypothetical protein
MAFSIATSSGSESSGLITKMESQNAAFVRAAPIHNAAISQPPAVAKCLRHAPVDAFEKVAKLRRRDRHDTIGW